MNEQKKLAYGIVLDTDEIDKGKDRAIKDFQQLSNQATSSGNIVGKAVSAMGNKMLLVGTAIGAIGASVAKVIKDMVSNTQKYGDAWQAEVSGWKSAYQQFIRQLASNDGWSNLLENMAAAYDTGKEVAMMLDEIFERQNSLSIEESKYRVEIANATKTMRDATKSDEERRAAAQLVIDDEAKIAEIKESIAEQEMEAAKKSIMQQTALHEDEMEFIIDNYNANINIIRQASEYNDAINSNEKAIKKLRVSYNLMDLASQAAASSMLEQINQLETNITSLNGATDESVKGVARILEKYNLSGDNLIAPYVAAKSKAYNAKAEGIQAGIRANSMLANLSGDKESQRKAAAEMAKKAQEVIIQAEKDMWIKVQDAEVNTMQDGTKKRLKQIELQRQQTIDAIRKEKSDLERTAKEAGKTLSDEIITGFEAREAAANKVAANSRLEVEKEQAEYIANLYDKLGDVFVSNEQRKIDAIHKTYEEQVEQLKKDLAGGTINQSQFNDLLDKADKAQTKEIQDFWIQQYGNFDQKLQALKNQWAETMKNIPAEFAEEANKQMNAAISDFIINNSGIESTITRLFDDMTEKSVSDLRKIASEGQALYDFLKKGEWNDSLGQKFNISKEQFETIRKSPDELEKIRKAILGITEAADENDTAFKQFSKGLKEIFSAGNNSTKLAKGLELVSSAVSKATAVTGFLEDSFQRIANSTGSEAMGKIAEGISAATDAMSSAMSGAQAGAAFGPWGAAAGAAIGLVTSLYESISKIHDERIQKKIEQRQEQVESLSEAYDELSELQDEAFGRNKQRYITQQNENLKKQNELIRQQISEEESKKNTDSNAIEEWQKQIKENNKLIEENKENFVDAIFGSDINSAIEGFGEAMADAWTNGNKGAASAKEYAKTMLKQMVNESVKAYIQAQGYMDRVRSAMADAMADDIITEQEKERIYKMSEDIANEIDRKYGWATDIYSDKQREGLKGSGIAASQDSVDNLDARMTTVQGHTYTLVQGQAELVRATNAILEKVAGIEENTSRSDARLSEISSTMNRVRNTIDDISLKGVKLRS